MVRDMTVAVLGPDDRARNHLPLEVAAGNEAARRACERHGFAATSKEPFTEGGTVYSLKLR